MKKTSIDLPQEIDECESTFYKKRASVEIYDEVTVTLPLTLSVKRSGHVPVFENGSMIVVNTYAMLYGQLEEPFGGPYINTMKDGSHSGVVVDRVWYFDKKRALSQVLAKGVGLQRDAIPFFSFVVVELWYHVMMHEGLFWVRYDWVDIEASQHA